MIVKNVYLMTMFGKLRIKFNNARHTNTYPRSARVKLPVAESKRPARQSSSSAGAKFISSSKTQSPSASARTNEPSMKANMRPWEWAIWVSSASNSTKKLVHSVTVGRLPCAAVAFSLDSFAIAAWVGCRIRLRRSRQRLLSAQAYDTLKT